jgi:predicted enzyme related to lactoylglutathione lyase
MAAFPTDEGAVVYETNTQPGNSGVVVSLNVPDSIEEALERVIAFGGKVLREKTKIEAENMGYFALFLDCEGNRLGSDADA